ncbi:MAG TPA: glycosyltransferase family 4 protein [Tepidisphaeraceae bacterium]|jgi:glycosyltransferase involved in cell wall biosynthesis|nr:glycosyltransferase family 4 protein [Tepidisphaeraceae bacterium]
MRILICHNFYQQPGGEDQVFAAEVDLLRKFGHDVTTFEMDNDDVASMSKPGMIAATIWNSASHRRLRRRTARARAEVVHFHNTFPLMSPSAYSAARAEGAAVVQTLHNFRLLCPGANLFRDGKACESCIGKRAPWPGVVHKCYRENRSASAAVAAMIAVHHAMGTWRNAVDLYLAPTEFARGKFIAGGWAPDKLFVKPNFVDPDPGVGDGAGGFAIFVARLSHEKGLETLLAGWEKLAGTVPLKIIGDGPLAPLVVEAQKRMPHIQWLGRRPLAEVYDTMGKAALLIFPSRCYETFGRVAAEAYAKGTPVVASRHGAAGDIVRDGSTGVLFEPGSACELGAAVRRLLDAPATLIEMRRLARREFEAKYTGDANHNQLMTAYRLAIDNANLRVESPSDDDGVKQALVSAAPARRRSISLRVVTPFARPQSAPAMREPTSFSDPA